MKRTLWAYSTARTSLVPAVRTNGTAAGVAVSLADFGPGNPRDNFRDGLVAIATGTVTDGSHAFALEDSADGSTGWAAMAAGRVRGSLPTALAADDNKTWVVGFEPDPTRPHVRVTCTTTGATSGGASTAVVILGDPRRPPVTQV